MSLLDKLKQLVIFVSRPFNLFLHGFELEILVTSRQLEVAALISSSLLLSL